MKELAVAKDNCSEVKTSVKNDRLFQVSSWYVHKKTQPLTPALLSPGWCVHSNPSSGKLALVEGKQTELIKMLSQQMPENRNEFPPELSSPSL